MVTHASHTPQGVAVGPWTQHRALASTRAAVVLPTSARPAEQERVDAPRPFAKALASVRVTCSCLDDLVERLRPVFSREDQIDMFGGSNAPANSDPAGAQKKVAPGTRFVRYRCSLPGLAGFTDFASPGTISPKKMKPSFSPRDLRSFAEREGFEPSVPCGTHDFQSCTFGLSVTSPDAGWVTGPPAGHPTQLRCRWVKRPTVLRRGKPACAFRIGPRIGGRARPYRLGGERGIRTPGTLAGTSDFESGAFNQALPSLQMFQVRNLAKNSLRIAAHSPARTPAVTSMR